MSSNSLFFIFLISFALVACNSFPKVKKSCFVEVEVEYSEEHENMFNQFSDMFEDSSISIENPVIQNQSEEVEEDDEFVEETEDDNAKIEHLIPPQLRNNCVPDSLTPSFNLIKNFKKLCILSIKIVFIQLLSKYAKLYVKQTMNF